MTGRTHELVGAGTVTVACSLAGAPPALTGGMAAAAWLTSRLPDRLELGGRLRHRGPTHRFRVGLVVAFILGLPALLLGSAVGPAAALAVGGGALAGYWLHIVADRCTVSGTMGADGRRRWCLPRGLRLRTGGPLEMVFRLCLLVGVLLVVAVTYAPAG